jgi:hypothetical protein
VCVRVCGVVLCVWCGGVWCGVVVCGVVLCCVWCCVVCGVVLCVVCVGVLCGGVWCGGVWCVVGEGRGIKPSRNHVTTAIAKVIAAFKRITTWP